MENQRANFLLLYFHSLPTCCELFYQTLIQAVSSCQNRKRFRKPVQHPMGLIKLALDVFKFAGGPLHRRA